MSNITLCYRDKNSKYKWNCEYGFQSIEESDIRTFELLNHSNKFETRLYTSNKLTPNFIQKSKIIWNLSYVPEVNMIEHSHKK